MILRRYMSQQVAVTTVLVLGFLTVLMLGGRLIRYFGMAAEGRLDVGLLFVIIGYNLPYFLELILPLSFFIALMLVFGRLYVDNEMAVLNGSGISRGRLARLMLPLIVLLFVVEGSLSLVVKPWAGQQSQAIWQQQAMKSAFDLLKPGEFISSGQYHLYVGAVSAEGVAGGRSLEEVILIQTPMEESTEPTEMVDETSTITETTGVGGDVEAVDSSAQLPSQAATQLQKESSNLQKDTIILAQCASQVPTEQANLTQLDLHEGRRYEVAADTAKYTQVGFSRYRISLSQADKLDVHEDSIETQPLSRLWQAASASDVSSTARQTARAELGYRLALPWLMILAPMLAVPLAQVQPRQGRWLRLLPSILLYVSCAMVVISLKNTVIKGRVSEWVYLWVLVAMMGGALLINWRSRLQQRLRFAWLPRWLSRWFVRDAKLKR